MGFINQLYWAWVLILFVISALNEKFPFDQDELMLTAGIVFIFSLPLSIMYLAMVKLSQRMSLRYKSMIGREELAEEDVE